VTTEPVDNPEILTQTVKSPNGVLTTIILNKADQEQVIMLTLEGISSKKFYLYRVVESEIVHPDFKMNPIQKIKIKDGKEIKLIIPAKSIHTLTTLHTLHEESAKR
jgi:hypothetical protein